MTIQGFSFIPKLSQASLPPFPSARGFLVGEVSCQSITYLTYAVLKDAREFSSPEPQELTKVCKKIQKCLDHLPGFCKGPECWGEAGFRFKRIRIPNTFETANFSKCGKDVFEECKQIVNNILSTQPSSIKIKQPVPALPEEVFDSSLTSEEVVNKIIEQEKAAEEQKKLDEAKNTPQNASDYFSEELEEPKEHDDKYWEKRKQSYLKKEKWLRENKDKIPRWAATGPLHYGMSPSQMGDAIRKKLSAMVASGHLMTENSLNQNHVRTTFSPATGKGHKTLTTIWTAEFLQSKLDDPTLKIVNHFLIVNEEATEVEVEAWMHRADYPCLSVVKNGYILSKNITGEPKAFDYRNPPLSDKLKFLAELKYSGLKANSIIRDSNHVDWLVDIDLQNFDHPPTLPQGHGLLRDYLAKRFEALYGDSSSSLTFKIPLSEIGLN
ncbi:MAG: hypothetical protein ACM3JI_05735 [Anaerolineae bacterium]